MTYFQKALVWQPNGNQICTPIEWKVLLPKDINLAAIIKVKSNFTHKLRNASFIGGATPAKQAEK